MAFTILTVLSAALVASRVSAESHTVKFDNKCGSGTPTLIVDGKAVSTGQDYTSDAAFAGIAYLQTGSCGFNGEKCTLMEMNLANPQVAGGGSSTDISLITPHAFSVTTSFAYYGGCENLGATTCASASCNTAFFKPDDNQVQVQCEDDNVNLLITFCGEASDSSSSSSSKPASSPSTTAAAASATSELHNNAAVSTHTTSKAVATSSSTSVQTQSKTAAPAAASSTRPSRKTCSAAAAKRRALIEERENLDLSARVYAEAELAARAPAALSPRALRSHRRRLEH
ncbi:hypothetical protein PLICRDRAFT_37146 [Plicaturopsis crispa FD-325 SS-3]|nr:hypothetical protein PLICRDRAFT_37146 [Plicaturopsis crispa FD-325 SS-3]